VLFRTQPLVVLAAALVLYAIPALAQEHTTLGGYGEAQYTNMTGPNTPGEATLRRFVVYLAHGFNDQITLHSELEVEDARVEPGGSAGELEVEQAYLDYRLKDWLTVRTGLILAPIGILNETHEPTTFNGVQRPGFDTDVIPTTWRELGVGAVGQLSTSAGLSYRLYLLNGVKAEGFSAEQGIREGRQEGQDASFANPSITGRLEWARPGLKVGGSFWYGGSANGDPALGTGTFAAPVALFCLDARYDRGQASFRGELANITVGNAEAINGAYGVNVGSRIAGGYAEAAYNVLALLAPASSQKLTAFLRYEQYNTQASVPTGTIQSETLARRITTFGFTYKPIYNAVFKGDYQILHNRAGIGEFDIFALGIGYQF